MTKQGTFTVAEPHRAFLNALKAGTVLLCLAALSGCMANTPSPRIDAATRYPFQVDSKLVTQPVVFQSGQVELDQVEMTRVDAFVSHFMRGGGNMLEIRLAGTDAQAEARLQTLRQYVLKRGVRPHELRVSRIAGASGSSGPLILSFDRFTAKSVQCDNRNAPTADNPTNMPHPDLGCSMRSNMAAMIANPADLSRPQPEQPGDAMRRSRVIQNYRAGEPTEAARGDSENAGSIRDLGG